MQSIPFLKSCLSIYPMKQRLPEYGVIGVGREDGKVKGEYSALWYKKARFELLASGYFWLSETPEIAGSRGWDGACERIASWGKLKDKISGKEYFALNTHLDHILVNAASGLLTDCEALPVYPIYQHHRIG